MLQGFTPVTSDVAGPYPFIRALRVKAHTGIAALSTVAVLASILNLPNS